MSVCSRLCAATSSTACRQVRQDTRVKPGEGRGGARATDSVKARSNLLHKWEFSDSTFIAGQPRFFNQQFAARDPYGLAAAWTTEALNTNA